ncbi:MAG TPA: DUF2934 domain-containing protein [Verrucomicrobiae bacterium]|nr:DUF2934 domain-containing protein [Verrucomicrobiae bacterium]
MGQTSGDIELSRAEIAARARKLWKAAGCPLGCDPGCWLRAEIELLRAISTRIVGANSSATDVVR